MPTKPEEKIQVNKKTGRRGMHRPMVMDVGKGEKLKIFVLLRILNISGGKEKIKVFQSMKEFYHPCLRLD